MPSDMEMMKVNGEEHPLDVLDDGEDVSLVSDRDLILRAVNASLVAKAVGEKVDALMNEVRGLRAAVETLMGMVASRS